MSKRSTVRTTDVDITNARVGDQIVLEDGSLATITTLEPREVEIKQIKKVYYLEYEAADKKGRRQQWSSVHMDDEQVERVAKPFSLVSFLKSIRFPIIP